MSSILGNTRTSGIANSFNFFGNNDPINFNLWGDGSINRSGSIDTDAPTYVIIHGWRNTGGNAGNGYRPEDWMANHAQTLRQRESNANIILVDWEEEAGNPLYFPSANKTDEVGDRLATFLSNLSVNPNDTTLIGHSLGAHIAGFAGTTYRQLTGSSLSQIVGLDPAGPAFESRGFSDRLDPTDATRVTSFHTSKTLGFYNPLSTLDFYVNENDLFQPGQWNFAGNHGYANTLFAELLQGYSFIQPDSSLLNLNTVVNAGFFGEDNVSTKNNKFVVPLNLGGTFGNDNLAGGAANDTIQGGAGDDKITGGDGNDALLGNSGDDLIYGGLGDDLVVGGTGSDRVFGDGGDDELLGVEAAVGQGFGEIDRLIGGTGRDRFILGTAGGSFYDDGDFNSFGIDDYALISDFNPGEDEILLSGSKSNYSLFSLGASTVLPGGTGLFLNESRPELVAIVQGSGSLDLGASYFTTV
ncbi:MAG: hypothetical protein SW833_13825 [Cyanobacteriota bacterium]|nr:hypothetical protein [Cyanobacteriota bacterium]